MSFLGLGFLGTALVVNTVDGIKKSNIDIYNRKQAIAEGHGIFVDSKCCTRCVDDWSRAIQKEITYKGRKCLVWVSSASGKIVEGDPAEWERKYDAKLEKERREKEKHEAVVRIQKLNDYDDFLIRMKPIAKENYEYAKNKAIEHNEKAFFARMEDGYCHLFLTENEKEIFIWSKEITYSPIVKFPNTYYFVYREDAAKLNKENINEYIKELSMNEYLDLGGAVYPKYLCTFCKDFIEKLSLKSLCSCEWGIMSEGKGETSLDDREPGSGHKCRYAGTDFEGKPDKILYGHSIRCAKREVEIEKKDKYGDLIRKYTTVVGED